MVAHRIDAWSHPPAPRALLPGSHTRTCDPPSPPAMRREGMSAPPSITATSTQKQDVESE